MFGGCGVGGRVIVIPAAAAFGLPAREKGGIKMPGFTMFERKDYFGGLDL